jgi:hypothetical protein
MYTVLNLRDVFAVVIAHGILTAGNEAAPYIDDDLAKKIAEQSFRLTDAIIRKGSE